MIVIENPIKDPNIDSDSLDILGLGIVTITDKAHNVFYVKGIGNSLMNKMIQLYKEEIRLKQEGKIIDFNTSGKFFTTLAYGTVSMLLQPVPGDVVTAKTWKFFKADSIDPRFTRGEPPDGFEPMGNRFFAALHNCNGS